MVAAESVRDQLSQDIWHILSRLDRTLAQPPPPDGLLRPQLDNVLQSLLAVAGVVHESMVRDQTWGFLDGGIRVERAQLTVSLLRATLATERPPIIDGTVTEAVLEASESIITHRRRTAADEGPAWPVHSAVSLLLLDLGNPRSVAFQVGRLEEALRMAGDSGVVARVAALGEHLASLDLVALCAGDRSSLHSTLSTVQTTLGGLSAELGLRYFGRKPPQRVLLGSCLVGGPLMSRQSDADFTPRRYEVRHRTTYTYDADVTTCYERGFLRPRDTPTQRVVRNDVVVESRARPGQRARRPLRQPQLLPRDPDCAPASSR